MPEFFPEMEVRPEQAEAIGRGLFAVARADGQIHEREASLINEFFASISGQASNLGALERMSRIDGDALAQLLPSSELRQLFIKTALLVGYADSKLSSGESQLIHEYAAALKIDTAQLATMETQVKEFLLSHLSHLSNVEAAAEVAHKLKV
jgi:tellurite resistance protein